MVVVGWSAVGGYTYPTRAEQNSTRARTRDESEDERVGRISVSSPDGDSPGRTSVSCQRERRLTNDFRDAPLCRQEAAWFCGGLSDGDRTLDIAVKTHCCRFGSIYAAAMACSRINKCN